MSRSRLLAGVVAFAILGVIVVSTSTAEDKPVQNWKQDWGAFVADLAPYLKRGAAARELKEKFEGQTVTWIGKVEKIAPKPDSTLVNVTMTMPSQSVTLWDGSVARVVLLTLSPSPNNIGKWQGIKAGDTVRFKTTLKGNSTFPAISTAQGTGPNGVVNQVWISTDDGEPIGESKETADASQSSADMQRGLVKTPALLPPYTNELTGENEVRISNPNDFAVTAGIRSGERGKNIEIPAKGIASGSVPDGKYDIFFVYSNRPDALFQGDGFTLSQNGVEIRIVQVVGGNYGIRQVPATGLTDSK